MLKPIMGVSVFLLFSFEVRAETDEVGADSVKEIEEIIVSARRRDEHVLDVPLAISTIESEFIDERNLIEFNQLEKYVSNTVQSNFGQGNTNHAVLFMRGTGLQDHIITTDPSVGIYLDGVYLGRNIGANFDLGGIERIEIVRGPQGSISGRNALGGAVHVFTRLPRQETAGNASLLVGNRNRLNVNASFESSLADSAAWSGSIGWQTREGVGETPSIANPEAQTGEIDRRFGRFSLSWDPNQSISTLLRIDFARANQGVSPHEVIVQYEPNGLGLRQADQPTDPDDTYSANNELTSTDDRTRGISFTVDAHLNDSWSVKTLFSLRDMRFDAGLDNEKLEPSLIEFPEIGESNQASLEVQLHRTGGTTDWVGGIHAFSEDGFNDSPFVFRSVSDSQSNPFIPTDEFDGLLFIEQDADSWAVFSHVTITLSEFWDVGLGLRHTVDSKDAGAFLHYFPEKVSRSDSWSATTGDASISRHLTSNSILYGTYARGYQAGGFPPRPFSGPDAFVSFDPTFADSFEFGFKHIHPFGTSLNVVLFHVVYTDLAVQVSQLIEDGFLTLTRNAAESQATGIEFEGSWHWHPRSSVDFAFGLIDIEFSSVASDVTDIQIGDVPAMTPSQTVSLSPSIELPMKGGSTITARLDWYHRSDMYGEPINTVNNKIPSLTLLNLHAVYKPSGNRPWTLGFHAKNLTDEVYPLAKLDLDPTTLTINSNDRREYGLRLNVSF